MICTLDLPNNMDRSKNNYFCKKSIKRLLSKSERYLKFMLSERDL